MTTSQYSDASVGDARRRRAASRDVAPGLAVLIVSQASLVAVSPDVSAGGWHLAWALTPFVGLGLLVWAQIRIFERADERERGQELLAMAIAFGVVMFALAGIGVLQSAGIGEVEPQLQVTTGLGVATWVVATLLLRRRTA